MSKHAPWGRSKLLAGRAGAALVLVGFGAFAGFHLRSVVSPVPPKADAELLEQRETGHRFVRPLIECDPQRNAPQNRALEPFHAEVEEQVHAITAKGEVGAVAVYFRELNDGLWFSVGEHDVFTPASLRKLPLMIAVLKQAEGDPELLERSVKFAGGQNLAALQNFPPSRQLEPGKEYRVHDLITRMIVYSDNNAFALLTTVVDERVLREVYGVMGSGFDGTSREGKFRSVISYAGFFRVLFNGSYLSWQRSDQALELLSRTELKLGLVGGVPVSVPVAHKFAEHVDDSVHEFHDCGIVYYPGHPYLLCVMSRGRAFEPVLEAVSSISRLVYQRVDAHHRDAGQ